ncbi:hypothetical protein C3B44_00975 [Corynebacterium yudongzhengii]|uniref:Serine protease n=1 Tax=Corynebacterium yudongzhengii TaxID=2080740 RepID=A0A2U1T5F8_9CORY|nr:MarP family serine protease [Corynebacterium yudongzhengii]AWB81087.1 hypothetical protein C3B44_00975 [Corynebacterium yudongzhengii]PWC01221.1 serine protease [Corynebacterium yudongzhengii]
MTAALVVDVLLVIVGLIALVSGWRQGAVGSVLSAIGIVAGLIIGVALAPLVGGLVESSALRFLLALAVIVLIVSLGNLVGGMLGAGIRNQMRRSSAHLLDSAVGALFQFVAVLVVVWMVSVPLAAGLGPPASDGVRNSKVLRTIDSLTPDSLAQLPARLAAVLDDSGLPPLVSPFLDTREDVEAPSQNVAGPQLVEALRPSIIHVMGAAEICDRRLMGSGFVTAPDYVITNAHVVAGTQSVRLDTVLGVKEADVVYFNPNVDIAVLHSPGLGLEPLVWAQQPASTGDDALVLGHPGSGPFEAAPARIADRITISGSDIYANGRVEREAYAVRGSIREGNSGGPLVNRNGEVLGVVFGASRENSSTGFAVTAREVQRQVGEVTQHTQPVDTQACVGA